MFNQRMKHFLLTVAIIIPVVVVVSLLDVGPGPVIAKVQSDVFGLAAANQNEIQPSTQTLRYLVDTQLRPQSIITGSNYSTPPDNQPAHSITIAGNRVGEGELSVESTNSGAEYIPASAFRHDGETGASGAYKFSVLGGTFPGGYLRNNSSSGFCMAAPAYVPDNATITEFSMFFMDDHPTSDIWVVYLWRRKHSNVPATSAQIVADLEFLDSLDIDDTTVYEGYTQIIDFPVVDNQFGYYVTFCMDGGTGLQELVYGFKVQYNP
ncbi:MAG: hypothetical protein KDI79_31835 [Anaerolineae bacterium]|nr:hypothetical protein [Anaerolineae bacterium]